MSVYDLDRTVVIIALILALVICFCAVQLRGCNKEANDKLAELAKQGVQAELGPNGTIRILNLPKKEKE